MAGALHCLHLNFNGPIGKQFPPPTGASLHPKVPVATRRRRSAQEPCVMLLLVDVAQKRLNNRAEALIGAEENARNLPAQKDEID